MQAPCAAIVRQAIMTTEVICFASLATTAARRARTLQPVPAATPPIIAFLAQPYVTARSATTTQGAPCAWLAARTASPAMALPIIARHATRHSSAAGPTVTVRSATIRWQASGRAAPVSTPAKAVARVPAAQPVTPLTTGNCCSAAPFARAFQASTIKALTTNYAYRAITVVLSAIIQPTAPAATSICIGWTLLVGSVHAQSSTMTTAATNSANRVTSHVKAASISTATVLATQRCTA